MSLVLLTPNWRLATGLAGTDTLHPPPAWPLEWGYVLASTQKRIKTVVLDDYVSDGHPRLLNASHGVALADAVVISTTPSYLYWRCPPLGLEVVAAYVEALRQVAPRATVLLVGPHGTVSPRETLRRTGADAALRGEVDPWLSDAMHVLDGHTVVASPYLAKAGDDACVAPEADFGSRHVTYDRSGLVGTVPHTWLHACAADLRGRGGLSALVETARGCPFDCGYCLRAGFRRRLRLKSVDALRIEVAQLAAMDVRYVYLVDETFGVPRDHTHDVARLLHEYNILFGAQTRPDVWTPDRVQDIAKLGWIYAEVGTESLTTAGVRALGKFGSAEKVLARTALLRDALPFVGVNIVDVGNPDLGRLDRATATNERDNEGRRPPAFIPYPGTPWGEQALASQGRGTSWSDAELVYASYTAVGRWPWLLGLTRWRCARRALTKIFELWRPWARRSARAGTRFERG
jgi:anaerobic magnesium-protoporphyrin IX monomethyl ester cyclase